MIIHALPWINYFIWGFHQFQQLHVGQKSPGQLESAGNLTYCLLKNHSLFFYIASVELC